MLGILCLSMFALVKWVLTTSKEREDKLIEQSKQREERIMKENKEREERLYLIIEALPKTVTDKLSEMEKTLGEIKSEIYKKV